LVQPGGFFAHHIQVALQHHRRGGLVAFSGGLYDNDIIAGVTGMLQAAVFGELLAVIGDFLGIVCEKAPGCTKDMETEGLDLVEENGWVYARGTTLGVMMALLWP